MTRSTQMFLTAAALSVALFGGACTKTETAKPTESSGPIPGWQRYVNANYGFSLQYPSSTTETFRNDTAKGKVLSLELGPTAASSTAVSIPVASLDVSVIDGQGQGLEKPAYLKDGCYFDMGTQREPMKDLSLGANKACLVRSADAAAGNLYNTYWYTVPLGKDYVLLTFTIHSVSCGNYEHPGTCIPFDENRDSGFVSKIASALDLNVQKGQVQPHFESKAETASTTAYAIDFRYPVLVGANQSVAAKVDKPIDDFISTTTKVFMESAKANEEYQKNIPGGQFVLESEYSVLRYSDKLYNVIFHGYVYTGGAHGMPIIKTFIFDITDGRHLGLEDLFVPGSDYLKTVSDLAAQEITKRDISDADWIKSGTEPKAENYQDFYLSPDGLIVVFPPYQVAAYAAGPQEVLIPYQKLGSLLRPEIKQ